MALCVVTLAPKLAGSTGGMEPDRDRLNADVQEMLTAGGYVANMIDREYDRDHVMAVRGDCRLAAALTRPGGSDQALFGQLQRSEGRMWFYYRGAWSRD